MQPRKHSHLHDQFNSALHIRVYHNPLPESKQRRLLIVRREHEHRDTENSYFKALRGAMRRQQWAIRRENHSAVLECGQVFSAF
jgi:hypothetical protein